MNQQTTKRIYAIFETFLIVGFVLGFFYQIFWLTLITGLLIILTDILDVLAGILNPLFPVVFAIILATFIDPWYFGVFWSVVIFKIFNMLQNIMIIINPSRFKSIKEQETEQHAENLQRLYKELDEIKNNPDRDGSNQL